jgi:hypothetical protein
VGTPGVRFGGLSVFDSGSTAGATGSLFWDSQNNNWVYQQVTGSTYTGGMLISGPRNFAGLGNEQGTTSGSLMKGQGGDHMTSSAIFEDGYKATFYGTSLMVSSSGLVGIGETSPASKLSIGGIQGSTIASNVALLVGNNGAAGTVGNLIQIGLHYNPAGATPASIIGANFTSTTGYTKSDIFFATRDVTTDTAPTERLRITSAGNVGIGSTSPSTTLDVSGSGRFTGTLNIGNDVTNSSLVFKTGGSTNYSATISTNSNVDQFNILGGSTAGYDNGSSIGLVGADRYGTKTAGMLTLNAGNAVNNTAYGYISMNTGNTERLKITYAGNIGIGITNPDANLVIGNLNTAGKGSINGASGTINRAIINCPYPGAAALTLAYYSSAYGLDIWVNGDGTGLAPVYIDQRNTEAIIFRRSTQATAAESMRITGGGYVGIGTTSPTNTLQVNGNIRYGSIGLIRNTQVTLNGNSTTGDVFRFLDSNGNLLGNGAIAGTFHVVAYDTATGGNQTQYEIRLLSGGNGTGNASLTVVSNLTRGTAPMANLTLVNDGGSGGVKIQGTTAASGVTGAILWINFIGNVT